VEPPQQGENRFVLRRAGQLGVAEIGWHIPEASHADAPALVVLEQVLSAGVTSRLYQAMVEQQLAISVSAQAYLLRDPGLFTVEATLRPGVGHEEAERVLLQEVDKLKTENVLEKDLRKAKNIIITQLIYLRDSPFGVVNAIGESEASAGWKFYVDFPKEVEKITAKDIKRVAELYFTEDNRTVGYFVPRTELSEPAMELN